MGRTTITASVPLGPFPTLPVAADALDDAMTAADVTNKNQILLSGPIILRWHNTGASSRTVTITSAPDLQRRTGDITAYSVGAGEYGKIRIEAVTGWVQSDGYLYFEANNAEVKFGADKLS